MEYFENLAPLLKTCWFIAIPTSLIFIFQTIMTFIGVDSSDGLDADFSGDLDGGDMPFQLFSLRNLINFLLGFSWTGISLYDTISNTTVLVCVSLAVGIAFLLLFFLIIRQVKKLAEDNSFQLGNTVGKTADVYLKIPASRMGKGKVLVSVNGSVHELEAVTNSEADLPSGSVVKVVQVDNNLLVVEKF